MLSVQQRHANPDSPYHNELMLKLAPNYSQQLSKPSVAERLDHIFPVRNGKSCNSQTPVQYSIDGETAQRIYGAVAQKFAMPPPKEKLPEPEVADVESSENEAAVEQVAESSEADSGDESDGSNEDDEGSDEQSDNAELDISEQNESDAMEDDSSEDSSNDEKDAVDEDAEESNSDDELNDVAENSKSDDAPDDEAESDSDDAPDEQMDVDDDSLSDEDSEDVEVVKRSTRVRKQTEYYNDADFKDDDDEGEPTAPPKRRKLVRKTPATAKVSFESVVEKQLPKDASKIKDQPTSRMIDTRSMPHHETYTEQELHLTTLHRYMKDGISQVVWTACTNELHRRRVDVALEERDEGAIFLGMMQKRIAQLTREMVKERYDPNSVEWWLNDIKCSMAMYEGFDQGELSEEHKGYVKLILHTPAKWTRQMAVEPICYYYIREKDLPMFVNCRISFYPEQFFYLQARLTVAAMLNRIEAKGLPLPKTPDSLYNEIMKSSFTLKMINRHRYACWAAAVDVFPNWRALDLK